MKYKKVITYGTFDMFHIGHLNLINRIKQLGEYVIVGVSTDEFNEKKGKKCFIPYSQRAAIVGAISGVDKVIPEESWEQKRNDILTLGVDCFVMGDDWSGKFDDLRDICEVIYLPRTEGVSTTQLKKALSGITPKLKEDIYSLFEIVDAIKKGLE